MKLCDRLHSFYAVSAEDQKEKLRKQSHSPLLQQKNKISENQPLGIPFVSDIMLPNDWTTNKGSTSLGGSDC